jgi:hypothetical protein
MEKTALKQQSPRELERRKAKLEHFKKRVEAQPAGKRAEFALTMMPSLLSEDWNIVDMATLSGYGVDCRAVKERITNLLVCHFAGMCELNEGILPAYSFSAREIYAAKLGGIRLMIKEGFSNEIVLSRAQKMGFNGLQIKNAAKRLVNEAISKRELHFALNIAERFGIKLDVRL